MASDAPMTAAVFYGTEDVRVEDRPRPRPGPGEVVLKIGAAGICGTDLKIYTSGHPHVSADRTLVLGHELAGEVAEVGDGITSLTPGMRVGVAPNVGCGVCAQCVEGWTNLCPDVKPLGIHYDGAFAQYMRVPAKAIQQGNVVTLPDSLSDKAAALAEPLSCCLNGQEAVQVDVDDVVVIIGVGPIGAMHVALARLAGARAIIASDLVSQRLQAAQDLDADVAVNPGEGDDLQDAVDRASHGEGADAVIVAAPVAQAQQQAMSLVGTQGRINVFGGLPSDAQPVPIDTNAIHYRQVVLTGTTGSNVRQYRAAMNLIASGRIDMTPFIGARLPLDAFDEGIGRTKAQADMRILLQPST